MPITIEALETRALLSSMSLTDGATRNTSGIEWSDDRTLTVHGTRRSEVIYAAAFSADQMGETIVNYSPSLTLERQIVEPGFTIDLVRNVDGQPGDIQQVQFTDGNDATGLQLALSEFGAEDGVLIVASRRGAIERWVVRKS